MVGNSNRDSAFSSEKITDSLQTESTLALPLARAPSFSLKATSASQGRPGDATSARWGRGEGKAG